MMYRLLIILFGILPWMRTDAQILPFYDSVPQTSFTCEGRSYGYYADPEVDCQVFHICPGAYGVGAFSFLCPNQTVFNQAYLVCDHPYNVDCAIVDGLYSVNDNFFNTFDDDDHP